MATNTSSPREAFVKAARLDYMYRAGRREREQTMDIVRGANGGIGMAPLEAFVLDANGRRVGVCTLSDLERLQGIAKREGDTLEINPNLAVIGAGIDYMREEKQDIERAVEDLCGSGDFRKAVSSRGGKGGPVFRILPHYLQLVIS